MKLAFIMMISLSLLSTSVVGDSFANPRESQNAETIEQTNEYSNYIHFQPEWNSYPRNLIVDVTTTWDREFVSGQNEESDISKHGAKNRQNGLQYVNSKPVVSVQFDYMDCQSQWFHYAKTGLDLLGNNFALFNSEKILKNSAYSDTDQQLKLENGFAQFVPICTSKDSTNYEYEVSINDNSVGFDVYFVPSYAQQWNFFLFPEHFEHYDSEGCYGHNYQKFTGTCENVAATAGLLIVIPDELSRPMTKITVDMFEK